MRKKFAANLIFLITANLLVKPFWIFGIDRVVQNKVGTIDYGTYFAVFNYSYLFSIILDFGINNFNNRAISRSKERLNSYLLNLMLLKIFLSVIYLAFTFLCAVAAGFDEFQMKLLFVLALNQILLSVVLYFRSNISALQFFKTDSFVSVLDKLLSIIFCALLLWSGIFGGENFKIEWFVYAQTLALFITAIVSGIIVYRKTILEWRIWKLKFSKTILLKSAPFAMLALLMGIYYRIDAVMLERMLPDGKNETGIYAASFRLLDAVNQFGFLFATLLLPLFAGMIRKKENLKNLVKFSAELMFVGSATVALTCFFFNKELMQLLYSNSTEYWFQIFALLMFNFIPMSSVYIFGTLLTAKGSLRALNLIALSGVVINVGLNLFLIPTYHALGAVTATLITQTITALAHIIVAGRAFKFTFDIKPIALVFAFSILCAAAVFCIHQTPLPWEINFLLSVMFCAGVAALLKLIPVHELIVFVKSRASS